jgi:hypothetical protein
VIAFRSVPAGDGGAIRRPLLDVYLDAGRTIPQTCLLDTGARGVRLSAGLARAAGVRLTDEPNARDLLVGGVRSQVYETQHHLTVELEGRPVTWAARVSCCDPWPHPFGLLGLDGFFDRFDVLLQAREGRFSLTFRG